MERVFGIGLVGGFCGGRIRWGVGWNRQGRRAERGETLGEREEGRQKMGVDMKMKWCVSWVAVLILMLMGLGCL